ncbi:hypothetical protein K440DRAFT_298793 [Wilcoxina mikolae CBS 423.85]|nr:hypothetical protein K440DRAFT_298793 [Wilcoxina mikolae CBS 423.85]
MWSFPRLLIWSGPCSLLVGVCSRVVVVLVVVVVLSRLVSSHVSKLLYLQTERGGGGSRIKEWGRKSSMKKVKRTNPPTYLRTVLSTYPPIYLPTYFTSLHYCYYLPKVPTTYCTPTHPNFCSPCARLCTRIVFTATATATADAAAAALTRSNSAPLLILISNLSPLP